VIYYGTLTILSAAYSVIHAMPVANTTIGFKPEMLVKIDDHADELEMSRAEYVRFCVRKCQDTPFDEPRGTLARDGHGSIEESQNEGAA